jgi:hypothetical protein
LIAARFIYRQNMNLKSILVLAAAGVLAGCAGVSAQHANSADATRGWREVPFSFDIQKPYDLEVKDRYRFDAATGTHDFWIYFADKPHQPPPNRTTARTEMRTESFRSGEHMFGADVNVSPGTFACIMQVFDAAHGPVTMLIAHPDGKVTVGNSTVIKTNAIGNWWNLKATNDPGTNGLIRIYVDNVPVYTNHSRGPRDYYFKCGVYSRKDSERSEARFKNVKMWVRE